MQSSPSRSTRFSNSPRSQRILTTEQREMVATFKDFTNSLESDITCAHLLEAHGWDVDSAVIAALSGDWAISESPTSNPLSRNSDIRNRMPTASVSPRHQSPRTTSSSRDLSPRVDHLSNDIRLDNSLRSTGRRQHNGRVPLLGRMIRTVFTPIVSIFGDGVAGNPLDDAKKFSTHFDNQYGDEHPHFLEESYRQATVIANRESKFLVVYLHSEEHDDTHPFCSTTLCSDALTHFFESHRDRILLWGGSVQYPDAYAVSDTLGCARFPFLAVLLSLSQGVTVVEKLFGNTSSEVIITRLTSAMETHQHVLDQAQTDRSLREEASFLREEQDREYRESLEADRLREAQLEEKRENEERKQRLEAANAEREKEEQMKLFQKKMQMLAKKKESLPQPPVRGTPGTAFLRFQLHNGSRLERCFLETDTLALVRTYIDVQFHELSINIENYELATNYPRRTWGPEDTKITLLDAGLCPQAIIYVQNLDS